MYRRAKAHVGAWNPNLAEEDFNKLKLLNPTITTTIDKEIENLNKMRRQKEEADKESLKKLFTKENGI